MSESLGELRVEEDGHGGMRFERVYDATAEEVWAALTEPAQLRGWLAEVDNMQRLAAALWARQGPPLPCGRGPRPARHVSG